MLNSVVASNQVSPDFGGVDFDEVLPDCPERDLVTYLLLRTIHELFSNPKGGGKTSGPYRKECRARIKSALYSILSPSEEGFSFRWCAKALGFCPDRLKARLLFDAPNVAALLMGGVRTFDNTRTCLSQYKNVQIWNWDEAPIRYQLSDKEGLFIIKMSAADADAWMASIDESPLGFMFETFEMTHGDVVIVVTH